MLLYFRIKRTEVGWLYQMKKLRHFNIVFEKNDGGKENEKTNRILLTGTSARLQSSALCAEMLFFGDLGGDYVLTLLFVTVRCFTYIV